MKRIILITGLIIAIAVIGWFVMNSGSEITANQPISETSRETSTANRAPDLVLGRIDAPIAITEYADFKCPTCNKFTRSSYIDLKREYLDTGKAKIVFRNLPFIAADSRTAAEGAYCANEQSKFSDYHDLLYRHIWDEYYSKGLVSEGEAAPVFDTESLVGLVSDIGIDASKFKTCLDDEIYKDAVTSDLKLSEKDGATGTPTFVIGKQKIVGAQPFGIFDKLIKVQ